MTPERYQQIKDVYFLARDLSDEDRETYLKEACADDADLRREVEALLIDDKQVTQFLESPVLGAGFKLDDEDTLFSNKTSGPPPSTFQTIKGYEILGEISRGAQGVVYRAVQKATKRVVALKVMLDGPDVSASQRHRFEREIDLVASLQHPNIVTIYDSGVTHDKRHYFAMEYIHGQSLDAYLSNSNFGIDETLRLFQKICSAVNYAHQRGVIHRDLKPGNIRVDTNGEPYVLDFGLAKTAGPDLQSGAPVTVTGKFMGTLAYASPEQTKGVPSLVDIRTDVYSLGVILYEMLTGRYPYIVVAHDAEVLKNIAEAEPKRPSSIRRQIDIEVETIILKALSKERERRYQSVETLASDIGHYLKGEPIDARRDSSWYVFQKSVKRHQRAIAIVSLVGLIVVAAVAIVVSTLQRSHDISRRAKKAEARIENKAAKDAFVAAYSGLAAEPVRLPPTDWTKIQRDVTVHLNFPEQPTAFNPLIMNNRVEIFVCELLFESLFCRTAELTLIPNEHLVAGIDDTADPHTRVVRLRQDVRWHDGKPLTGEDVVFSWQQIIKEEKRSYRRDSACRLAEVSLVDTHTVKFVQRELQPSWQVSMNFGIVPKHLFETHAEEDPTLRSSEYYQALHRKPVGCGPFRFADRTDDQIILDRWEDYTGEKPHIQQLVIHQITSPQLKLEAFLRGDLDIFQLIDKQYREDTFSDAFADVGVRAKQPSTGFNYILWNCDAEANPFFCDPRVRLAMTYAVNLDQIITQVSNNLGLPCSGPWYVTSPFFDMDIQRVRFNLQRAAELLDDAGWRLDEDGSRVRNVEDGSPSDVPIPFSFSILVYSHSESSVKVAKILQESLAKIGITLTIESEGNGRRYFSRINKQQFDAMIGELHEAVDPDGMRSLFETDGSLNFGGFSNTEVDRLFDEGASLLDSDRRADCYRKIHRLIYDDQPMTFLYHKPSLWAVNKRLRGIEFSIRGPYLFYPSIRNWWVPKDAGAADSSLSRTKQD